jgi:SAM-dependent methyltransferase
LSAESGDARARESGEYWDRVAAEGSGEARYWLGVLPVRRWVNRRMTDDPDKLYIQRFLEGLSSRWPLPRAASIGCGVGDLERGAADLGAVATIVGSDIGEGSIRVAREAAAAQGLSDRVRYEVADAAEFLEKRIAAGERFDLIFFHGVLHHLIDLERVVDGAAQALREQPPGLIYIDEYMGPSRGRWTDEILAPAQGLFGKVPERFRRTPAVYPPIAMEDPTEMIRSDEIERIVRERLEIVEWMPYYGNVLNPLVCAIRGDALEEPEVVSVLEEAMRPRTSSSPEASSRRSTRRAWRGGVRASVRPEPVALRLVPPEYGPRRAEEGRCSVDSWRLPTNRRSPSSA